MVWIVRGMLGTTWVKLWNFQGFQSMLCEKRRFGDKTNTRRADPEKRRAHYFSYLWSVLWALGVDVEDLPVRGEARPTLTIPSWANMDEVMDLLVFFGALLLRFSTQILDRAETPKLLPGVAALAATKAFKDTRVNQWSYLLDRGTLVNIQESMLSVLCRQGDECMQFGWAQRVDITTLSVELWSVILPRVALGCTVLAEGTAHSRAVSSLHYGCSCSRSVSIFSSSLLLEMLAKAAPLAYPYGRAINAVGKVNFFLTGAWEDV